MHMQRATPNVERMATGARQTRRLARWFTQGFSSNRQNRIAKQPLNTQLHGTVQPNAPALGRLGAL